jgi:1,4-dihydroxy-2-naphthoate octaprenyltransferase
LKAVNPIIRLPSSCLPISLYRMSQLKLWVEGARLRTLPLALAPVFLGSATAYSLDAFNLPLAVLALLVSLLLQIGVNYANDYSDGIRGTDANRVGPLRLTGSGSAKPTAVKNAAFISFGLAALAGLTIILITSQWWLVALGLAAIIAAWFYTGGKNPYGYAGLGELAVFVFFGLVATVGTNFIQTGFIDPLSVLLGGCFGLYASAVLMVNNIRDIATDKESGKNTIAVRLGAKLSRRLFIWMLWIPVLINVLLVPIYPATIMGFLNLLLVLPATLIALDGKGAKELITALKLASFAGLGFGVLVGLGVGLVSFSI